MDTLWTLCGHFVDTAPGGVDTVDTLRVHIPLLVKKSKYTTGIHTTTLHLSKQKQAHGRTYPKKCPQCPPTL